MAVKDRVPIRREGDRRRSEVERREPWSAPWAMSPFALMHRMAEEMDRIFGSPSWGHEMAPRGWMPQMEVFEHDGNLVVRADLPGLKKDEVNIEVRDDALVIQGERRQEQEEEREGYFHSERHYGRFYRSIPLPEGTDPDKANATFRDGVLEVTMPMPRSSERRGRRVEIK